MKTEVGSFTPDGENVTVLLNDGDLNVKGLFLSIGQSSTRDEQFDGFSDGTRHRCKGSFTTSNMRKSYRSTGFSIIYYKDYSGNTVREIAGKPAVGGFTTPGQFTMKFDDANLDHSIDFMVVGD